jgi:hypothetical protein
MFSYRAFGLRIRSDIELPELTPEAFDGAGDIEIGIRPLGIIAGLTKPYHDFSSELQVLAYPEVGAFVIEGVDRIFVEPTPGAPSGLLAFPLLGPVMGLLLHLRGNFVLHASAVSLGGRGIGFLGDKGAGKSTLATTLLRQPGAALLTDDLLVFNDRAEILAAFPQVKLAPDALAVSAGLDIVMRAPPIENFPKQQVRLAGDVPKAPVPAVALYELHRDAHARMAPLSSSEAFRILIRFCYVGRFAGRKLNFDEQRRLFVQAAGIANAIDIKRLYVPDTLQQLSLVGDFLAAAHQPA